MTFQKRMLQEVTLHDPTCDECGEDNDIVETYAEGDEAPWECRWCGADNVAYWDDDPELGRGWIR